jgi:hypothetical protein
VNKIRVHLLEPTEQGRIYYKYDLETADSIISLNSALKRPWEFAINVENTAILYIDAARILSEADLMIPKRSWKVAPLPVVPQKVQAADLEFPDVKHKRHQIDLPIQTVTNESKSHVYIQFGVQEPGESWIALSEQCIALVANDHLKGFYSIALKQLRGPRDLFGLQNSARELFVSAV